jgi:hypothetical protein
MEHDVESIETIFISANSHEIRTLGAPLVALSNIGSRKRLPMKPRRCVRSCRLPAPLRRSAAEDAYSAFRLYLVIAQREP